MASLFTSAWFGKSASSLQTTSLSSRGVFVTVGSAEVVVTKVDVGFSEVVEVVAFGSLHRQIPDVKRVVMT